MLGDLFYSFSQTIRLVIVWTVSLMYESHSFANSLNLAFTEFVSQLMDKFSGMFSRGKGGLITLIVISTDKTFEILIFGNFEK